ncbi:MULTISPECIES: universal stress protein [unclassified Streptomyces]|uniref:universal stress protein n=1 Tax=unclassified Streptomyces TaxID=2593676 RepID=UPI00332B08E1
MKDRVSVGADGSEESRAAARWAAQEAVVRQVPLRLVHAVDWLLDPVVPGLDRQDAEQRADKALTATSAGLHRRHPQLEITTRSLRGRPAAALAAEAADAGLLVLGNLVRASQGAGLVVVGRRVRRSPLGAHLGSVAHAVLHHSTVPVAVIAHR